MELYQIYSVTILKEFAEKADKILFEHWNNGDIDTITFDEQKNGNGLDTVTYWIRPYIYEDFETIKKEFKEAGIRII